MKCFRLAGIILVFLTLGCTAEDTPNVSMQSARGSVDNPSENTLNSPTTGPSSAGLSGGPNTSRQSDMPGAPLSSGSRQ